MFLAGLRVNEERPTARFAPGKYTTLKSAETNTSVEASFVEEEDHGWTACDWNRCSGF